MALMAIQDWLLYSIAGISLLVFFIGLGLFMAIKNGAPDAMVHWKAKRSGQVICRVHYKGRQAKDYLAHIDKAEKKIGTPYWVVPTLGIKFKPKPDEIEFIEGSVPCVNYFENCVEGQKIAYVVAFSQLKDHLHKMGVSIETLEKEAFYVASEAEKVNDERAIDNAMINSEQTRKYLRDFLKVVKSNKAYLEQIQVESGVFSWQTAMRAIDDTIAYTSSNVAHMKETLKAVILKQEETRSKDIMMYGIVAFMMALGVAGIYAVVK